jgi:hypothetical protein
MKNWLKLLFSSDPGVSSKRFFGAIGFIWACILITLKKPELIENLLYVSVALLGLGSILTAFQKNKNNGQTGKTQDNP